MLEESSNQLIHVTFLYLRQSLYLDCAVLSRKRDINQPTAFNLQTMAEISSVGWVAVHRWEMQRGIYLGVLPSFQLEER